MERNFIVTLARFNRNNPQEYILQGYFQGNSIAGSKMRASADETDLPVEIGVREGLSVRKKYFARGVGYEHIDREYDIRITLPEKGSSFSVLKLFQDLDGSTRCVYKIRKDQLEKAQKLPDGYLETWKEDEEMIHVGGWAVGRTPCRIQVIGPRQQKLASEVKWIYRQDVVENYPEIGKTQDPEDNKFGFEVSFPKTDARTATLIIAADGQRRAIKLRLDAGSKNVLNGGQSLPKKVLAYLKQNGFNRTVERVKEKLREKATGKRQQADYMVWRKRYEPTEEALELQRRNVFLNQPLISIVVPLYKTDEKYLRELVASIQKQTYRNWELCFSDGSGDHSPLTGVLSELQSKEPRIHVVSELRPLGISENTNMALTIAEGEYIVFCDHDDLLPPYALYELVKKINEEPEADLFYSDEDKVSMDSKTFFEPHFKPDYNVDLLCSMNYFCHLVMVKRSLRETVGYLNSDFDGAQDYDFVLRCAEKASRICHIPMVLYHWRSHSGSTAENPESKRWAFEAGMRAVQAHFDRIGVKANVFMGEYPGLYRTEYILPEEKPLISIIIPSCDHIDDLDKCVTSLYERSTYRNFEIIVVENNSRQEETFAYYEKMKAEHSNFHVAKWQSEFNYSKLNNFGVEYAMGDYLLLLNNDTELLAPDALEQLVGPLMREETGIVGARLYYPDDTIQHAGVIIGYGGIAGHAFIGAHRGENGYFSRIICEQDLSAVTAACMMVKRSVYEEVGGFDPTLRVAFNDIDFCLKVRKAGYLVVYNPYAELYHYESKSRGAEDTPEKIARFNDEADEFLRRWPEILKDGDPYYNPNLSLDRCDFALKE